MLKPQHLGALLAALLLSLAASAPAQTRDPGPAPQPGDAKGALSRADRAFVTDAAKGGALEVQLGNLAAEKASSPKVKQFAERLIQDHSKANQELMQLAQQNGVAVSAQPQGKHQRLRDRLSRLSGGEFDRIYVKEMVVDHEKDVKAFRRMSQRAKDSQVKAFAAETLPTLEEHLRMAKDLEREVGESARPPRAAGG